MAQASTHRPSARRRAVSSKMSRRASQSDKGGLTSCSKVDRPVPGRHCCCAPACSWLARPQPGERPKAPSPSRCTSVPSRAGSIPRKARAPSRPTCFFMRYTTGCSSPCREADRHPAWPSRGPWPRTASAPTSPCARASSSTTGDPVTAEDVKFSFERYRGGGAKILKDTVKEVQTPAPNRVRFVFNEPWPDFPAFYGTFVTSAGWVVPKKYVERVGEEACRKAPIGAGPYKVVSFNPGVELVLEAFEGYWRKTPSIKRLVFRSLPDETTRAAALKSGEVDVAFLLTGPTAEDVRRTPGLKLVAPHLGIFWLDFPDQWDSKSPWADKRVRLAASLAIDRQALNQAETLGLSRPTGSIVPRDFEFALPVDPPPLDPKRARQLLAEAGYPNGFDAGEITPFPPYNSMGETIAGWLQAVGIRTRMRTMERGAFMTAWREKKLHGVVLTISGVSGNAATRLESFVTKNGAFAFGSLPEVDELFRRQAKELDRKKREALLFQIQRILQEQVTQAAVYHLGFPTGVGPRVDDILASAIPGFYLSPYEDLKLKKP
ncbi:MAG TPA: ABC transporter substrate-binding protein [Methylomirabilota bacterium]|nr:ABC transporter substrate-binding protein [Methylomirabilota bacterium]